MRSIGIIMLLSAFLLFGIPISVFAAGMFGIELGESIDKYTHEEKPVSARHGLDMFELVPPQNDSRFDTYAVDTYGGKIIRIMASSPDDVSADASATLAVFHSLKTEMEKLYGKPSLCLDEVEDAGNDLRSYLADEGGIEVLEWDSGGKESYDIGAIYVFLAGSENENGSEATYCTLYIENPEYSSISDQVHQKELEDSRVLPEGMMSSEIVDNKE